MNVFAGLLASQPEPCALRDAISQARRLPEPQCMAALLETAKLTPRQTAEADATALMLAQNLRTRGAGNGVEALMQTFSLGSEEGVALMCLAEALLRIPDAATRDALIRDQIGRNTWSDYIGRNQPTLVNAAAWGMSLTSRLSASPNGLRGLVAKGSAPFVRQGINRAIRMMGGQFVIGETIAQALRHSSTREHEGFTYSYDMLGEAALTAADAARFRQDYIDALEALGRHARGDTLYERPGLSIKLSALHPRYSRAQRARVMTELAPILKALAVRARQLNIGLNIDAEESERLELSLDLLQSLCEAPELAGWNGIGFVVQAYGKRAPRVLEWLIALGARTGHRLMVRLVKGAYWDSEIKRAQVEGQDDFPVFTRKHHTDISYIACARQLLDAPDYIYPQFATHNARTIATIHALAGPHSPGRYEFQCLHGMGETTYQPVVSKQGLNVPCRIYAPVGAYETLLAYLVRRLLENGANSSFVNQAADANMPIERLIDDPIDTAHAAALPGSANEHIARPPQLFGPERRNALGIDLTDEPTIRALSATLSTPRHYRAAPTVTPAATSPRRGRVVHNPAIGEDHIGEVIDATPADILAALDRAATSPIWAGRTPDERATPLERAADLLEGADYELLGLIVREAGKSFPNAIAELREAVDFLRFYAAQIRATFDNATHTPLGTIVCISPWNFPLAIFIGQIAAALAAGNNVIAKPAEETPLIAARAVELLHEAGIPPDALQFLPGDGTVGAALVEDPRVDGVMFTGSSAVAKLISRQLFGRIGRNGQPVPLVAETGGQNAMIVDSSALPEQAVADIIASAFDSAGQRCSALRVLLVQEECADRLLTMLCGAMRELRVGNPALLETDIGPVISAEAQARIDDHIDRMRRAGRKIWHTELSPDCVRGHFIAPTLIEIGRVADIGGEVFGPVLHVRRFARSELDGVVDAVNATGYGLTFGVHSRVRSTIERVCSRINAGNLYVNRNMIGAVVGSQPFGGNGLSGTGPKAGGPLTLRRLLSACPAYSPLVPGSVPATARSLLAFLETREPSAARRARDAIGHALCGASLTLPGPVGETNVHTLIPRGPVICAADSWPAVLDAVGIALAAGNTALVAAPDAAVEWMTRLPPSLVSHIQRIDPGAIPECAAILMEPHSPTAEQVAATVTAREGRVVPIYMIEGTRPEWLLEERVVTTNTAAVGGDAALMAVS
ncbi:bifunctional proline dehydrogenase/pyrroline-5-carboxylate dehydrogenase [Neoasaia chiangmaiensis NBRC 101099]|uniref:Bifunctional protein PutA n=1 Tax=Neoasaia chiangmaiensis TaxID=320497 RepID=A0A1U9KSC4_9PROT|nr:bifunctional proline dehydrogenase/L-glutamate gamma-semialdehyde dehydrogenase PutA [Neoasaia chiangmaiensis]AQS88741.1 trifunctional transcriptional regulator/proline dehydrogenase/L-glutamate gamma-semialdehyde dehydrogenase [Neoasaia chiangmaiensis]GBR40886.1 bifunctional proline dehydrogenase/pyrroline-5-carboxylate dehydrogenase [Neoasaia chiangmaiensis NBRC 101099]GEN13700.1 bifunctional protein PutA [Neoasaia chiangmaiensis]